MNEDSRSIAVVPPRLVSLVGLPGVGKSTVGRRLARRLGLAFVDCDSLFEQRSGRHIREFFESEGEERFRDAESALLEEMVSGPDTVIATGGGVVLRAANRELLRRKTICVYLRAHPDALFQRLRRDTKRPLLQVADPAGRLRELSAERDPLYREAAAFEVETHGRSSDRLVDAIVRKLPQAVDASDTLRQATP
ncbi:MAG: shikimate kinase [Caldimonas sp.]